MTATRQMAADANAAAAAAAAASAAVAAAAAAAAARKAAAAAAAAACVAAAASPAAGCAAALPRRSLAPPGPSGFGSQQRRSMLPAQQPAAAPPRAQKPAAGGSRNGPARSQARGAAKPDTQVDRPAGDPDGRARQPAQLPTGDGVALAGAHSLACPGAPEPVSVASTHAADGLVPADGHPEMGTSAPWGPRDCQEAKPRATVRLRLSLPGVKAAQAVGDGHAQRVGDGGGALMQAAAAHLRHSLFGGLSAQQALGGAGSGAMCPQAQAAVLAAARGASKAGVLCLRRSGMDAHADSAAPTAHDPGGQSPGLITLDPSRSFQPDLHVADDVMAAALGRRAAASCVGLGLGHARRSLVQLAAAVVDAPGLTPGRGITPPTGRTGGLCLHPEHADSRPSAPVL